MKRMIALRRSHPAFGRGSLQMLAPENRKVLAFLRRYGGETLLIVVNLSRYPQWVELELGEFAGTTPVELVGNGAFPPVDGRPYRLTLGGHEAFWLSLSSSLERQRGTSLVQPHLSPSTYAGPWQGLLSPGSALEPLLAVHVPAQRWFRSKARSVSKARLVDTVTLPHRHSAQDASSLFLAFVQLDYVEGDPETYVLPLCVLNAAEPPEGALMGLVQDGEATPRRWICDASRLPDTAAALEAIAFGEQRIAGRTLALRGVKTGTAAPASSEPIKPLGAEQSNTSFLFGQQLVGKLLRKVEPGASLEVDVLEALRLSHKRVNVPTLEARIDIESSGANATLWMSERFVPNEGDAWQLAVDHAQRFYETVLTQRQGELPPPMQPGRFEVDVAAAEEPDFLPLARLLGKRTAELHVALHASFSGELAPRPFTALSSRAFYQSVRNLNARAFDALKVAMLPERSRRLADSVLERRAVYRKLIDRALLKPLAGQRMRVHGDYHLGQVLYTGSDFHIIDFEGEPARSLAERRRLRSPLADVAGMMRSLHYAAFGVLTMQLPGTQVRPEDRELLEPWARYFAERCARAFLSCYCKGAEGSDFLPESPEELQVLLDIQLVEKALYELLYELNNRPTWAELPLRGLLDLTEG
jgi:maltose alpha-D-glucosyltransferase/alpha-amylase